MSETLTPDICVIGAGSGGLSVAAAAAQLGVSVVLLEKHKMGGDCLHYGCVPSKALIAASKRAHAMRSGNPFGIAPVSPQVDRSAVRDHIRNVIAAIEPNDSVERFTGLGVNVITSAGRFVGKDTLVAGETTIKARRFVVATGSSPLVFPIEGLNEVPFFTNETIFDNVERPEHLIVIGGGPIGLELAQAHLRLGSQVTVLEGMTALGKDDPELTEIALRRLRAEGLVIREGAMVQKIERDIEGTIYATIAVDGAEEVVRGTHLLVATGRAPNVADLGLEEAGIKFNKQGIEVNKGLRTSNRRVYAIGDVTGGYQFTHIAGYHAGLVVRSALFRLPVSVKPSVYPWCTYIDPELAHVGLSEADAREKYGKVNVLRWPYHENDRAQAEGDTDGLVKVVVGRSGKVLGASICGAHAGEIIQMWSLAIASGMKIKSFTGFISPYPTLSEINKRAAITHFVPKLANPMVRRVVGFLRRFD
ncbi:MAG: dihydrolipoyl dehydrogenase family protein [Hyphomicrobiaceae bacterium]